MQLFFIITNLFLHIESKYIVMKTHSFFHLLAFLVCTFCLTGCFAAQQLAVTNSASLDRANFKVIGAVSGQSKATYVFGIGGFSEKARTTDAMQEMYKSAKLKENQTIANISQFTNSSWILPPIVIMRTTTVTGTIVEFIPDGATPSPAPAPQVQNSGEGDKVCVEKDLAPQIEDLQTLASQINEINAQIRTAKKQGKTSEVRVLNDMLKKKSEQYDKLHAELYPQS